MNEHLALSGSCTLPADGSVPSSIQPTRAAMIQRQRYLAASECVPPALAAKFTVAQIAVLTIIANEVRTGRVCTLSTATVAARAITRQPQKAIASISTATGSHSD